MRACWIAVAFGLAATSAGPAGACVYSPPVDLNDVRHADAVVIGRIVNYRIVEDQETRRDRRILEANWPRLSPSEQRRRARQTRFLSDYARFEVVVEQVLAGRAGRVVTVTWDNSTFNEPEAMPAGRYLVALGRPRNLAPTDPRVGTMVPVQSSCSTAFIFEETSREARGVRAILERR